MNEYFNEATPGDALGDTPLDRAKAREARAWISLSDETIMSRRRMLVSGDALADSLAQFTPIAAVRAASVMSRNPSLDRLEHPGFCYVPVRSRPSPPRRPPDFAPGPPAMRDAAISLLRGEGGGAAKPTLAETCAKRPRGRRRSDGLYSSHRLR